MSETPQGQTLGALPWMTARPTAAVLDALEAAGGADCARFVGGCVRNALIGAGITDIDIATTLTPDQTMAALKAARIRAVPTGFEHGTVTAVCDGKPFEVTTLRRDVETDGRHAVVAFTDDWAQDAERRDFTLNALYARRDGTIFDPTGRGTADARAGRIVFVGAAEQRLREDYLRCLRFFRFYAWYGQAPAAAAALAACAAVKDQVSSLAAERITAEMLKLLAAADPREAVALMAASGVLAVVLPGALDLARFEALAPLDASPVLRLAALLAANADLPTALSQRLRLSNADRDRVLAALAERLDGPMSPQKVREAIYRLGKPIFRDRALLAWAGGAEGWKAALALADAWQVPVFPLGGEDAIGAGAPRGPAVGQALRAVEDWWIDQDFVPERSVLLEKLKSVV